MRARFGQLLAEPHGHALRVLSATGNPARRPWPTLSRGWQPCLQTAGLTRVASRLDNGPDWLILDLALRLIDAVHVPLPTFFSDGQVLHALTSSGAQCVVTDAAAAAPPGTSGPPQRCSKMRCAAGGWQRSPSDLYCRMPLPASPTPPAPRVAPRACALSADSLLTVAASLVDASAAIAPRRHLCLMPLSTLLENVAGLYATLLSGAQVALPSLAQIGYTGASGLDVPALLRCPAPVSTRKRDPGAAVVARPGQRCRARRGPARIAALYRGRRRAHRPQLAHACRCVGAAGIRRLRP